MSTLERRWPRTHSCFENEKLAPNPGHDTEYPGVVQNRRGDVANKDAGGAVHEAAAHGAVL